MTSLCPYRKIITQKQSPPKIRTDTECLISPKKQVVLNCSAKLLFKPHHRFRVDLSTHRNNSKHFRINAHSSHYVALTFLTFHIPGRTFKQQRQHFAVTCCLANDKFLSSRIVLRCFWIVSSTNCLVTQQMDVTKRGWSRNC